MLHLFYSIYFYIIFFLFIFFLFFVYFCFFYFFFFFQAEDGIRDIGVTGVQTCALPISAALALGVLFVVVYTKGKGLFPTTVAQLPETENTQSIALLLYRDYMFPFEIASLLLLVAIIGAVVMAKKRI